VVRDADLASDHCGGRRSGHASQRAGAGASASTGSTGRGDDAGAGTRAAGYDYKPAGRRDPFVSLVRRSTEALGTSTAIRPTGLAGLSTDEVVMRGVMKGRNGYTAIVRGADNRTYTGVKAATSCTTAPSRQ
jgi:hypothetical protein